MIAVLNLFDIIAGKEAQYAEYLRRVQPILDRYGAKVLLHGLTKMIFTGACTQEYCGVIAYDSLGDLLRLSRDPEFLKIVPLRDGATRNYVLTAVEDFETMNHAAAYLDGLAADPPGDSAGKSVRGDER